MLPSLGFKGTAEVVNKGVDVTLISDSEGKKELFELSRYLVVCGLSAAVVAVTELEPVDMKTIRYFEETTPLLLFFSEAVADKIIPELKPETEYKVIPAYTTSSMLKELPEMIKQSKEKKEAKNA